MRVRAVERLHVQGHARLDGEGLEEFAHQFGVERADLLGRERGLEDQERPARNVERRPASASRPWACGYRHSARCPSCRRAPARRPGRGRCRYPRWCDADPRAGRRSPSRSTSNRPWRANNSSMWSRKPTPVAISALPVPSRAIDTATSVSAVRRLTLASRIEQILGRDEDGAFLTRRAAKRYPRCFCMMNA